MLTYLPRTLMPIGSRKVEIANQERKPANPFP